MKSDQRIPLLVTLALATLLCTAGFQSAWAAKEKQKTTLDEILDRQEAKGDVLNVYLKNQTGIYVNGKQISLETLTQVVRKSKTVRAIVTAEPEVLRDRVKEVKEVIRGGGLEEIKVTAPQQTDEDARNATLNEILTRQETKGDVLNVYVRDATRVYVNGKQLSLPTLTQVVRKSKTERAVISAEPQVTRERIKELKTLIQEGGLDKVKVTEVKAN